MNEELTYSSFDDDDPAGYKKLLDVANRVFGHALIDKRLQQEIIDYVSILVVETQRPLTFQELAQKITNAMETILGIMAETRSPVLSDEDKLGIKILKTLADFGVDHGFDKK